VGVPTIPALRDDGNSLAGAATPSGSVPRCPQQQLGQSSQPAISRPRSTRQPQSAHVISTSPILHPFTRLHGRLTEAGRTAAITTNTADTARAINLAIQHANPRSGPRISLADGTSVRVGDRIATRRNDPALATDLGEKVRNRHTWTVTAANHNGTLTVDHPDRGAVVLPATYVAEHVELAWAVTGYGNQGDTTDASVAVLEPGTSRSHAYVAMTRGRDANLALIPDHTGALDPAEALAEMITGTPGRESALATRHRLHHDAGLSAPPIGLTDLVDNTLTSRAEALQR
jgi:ATP-dependent exoDNAse (exonuclease V) alpha subunit